MIPKRIKDHAETTDHDIDTGYVEILEKNVNNWHKKNLFGIMALHNRQECGERAEAFPFCL